MGAVREEPEGGGIGARANGRRRSTQPEKKAGAAGGQGHLSRRRSRVLGRRRDRERSTEKRNERRGAGRGFGASEY
jgi:hypothetical protein